MNIFPMQSRLGSRQGFSMSSPWLSSTTQLSNDYLPSSYLLPHNSPMTIFRVALTRKIVVGELCGRR